jgi:hypothetical protein
MSVAAVTIGGWLFIPPLLSVYNYGQRIKRAQRMAGVPASEQINPALAFLLSFPLGILVIPVFIHYWYVTRHQNRAVRARESRSARRSACRHLTPPDESRSHRLRTAWRGLSADVAAVRVADRSSAEDEPSCTSACRPPPDEPPRVAAVVVPTRVTLHAGRARGRPTGAVGRRPYRNCRLVRRFP